jgi:hypothetical protein
MSLLDRLRRRRSPTAEWREDRGVRLIADLDRFELGGVKFGDPYTRLSFLGPSESPFMDYHRKGLRIDVADDRLDGFTLALEAGAFLGASSKRPVRPFVGRLKIRGRELRVEELRTEEDLTALWGTPFWRDEDDDEILLFFEFSHGEIQVELSRDGRPRVLVATPEHLMADPEQRRSYGVEAPWPPSFAGSDG